MADIILRLPQVKQITGLSRSTIYLLISKGTFPKQIKLSERAVGWLENDINKWIEKQIAKSNNYSSLGSF